MQKIGDELDRIGRQGKAAWQRLKKDKNFEDWRTAGQAVVTGRQWAMHEAGTNQAIGSAYNRLMSDWLARYGLDDMDKGARSRLVEMMDNIGAIEEWRKTLTLTARLSLNHPNSVVRKWRAATAIKEPAERGPSNLDTLRDDNRVLEDRIRVLEAEVSRDAGDPGDAYTVTERHLRHHIKRWISCCRGGAFDPGNDLWPTLVLAMALNRTTDDYLTKNSFVQPDEYEDDDDGMLDRGELENLYIIAENIDAFWHIAGLKTKAGGSRGKYLSQVAKTCRKATETGAIDALELSPAKLRTVADMCDCADDEDKPALLAVLAEVAAAIKVAAR